MDSNNMDSNAKIESFIKMDKHLSVWTANPLGRE